MNRVYRIASQGARTAWTDGQTVAIVDGVPVWPARMFDAFPVNSRWECSFTHWNRYFASVHAPVGWCDEREYNRDLAERCATKPFKVSP